VPIAAAFTALQSQIKDSLSLGMAATPDLFATVITTALASAVPSGIFPPISPSAPPPLAPVGAAAMQSQTKNAASLDMGATPDSVSASLATAIVSLVPMVPPAAQSALQVQLKNALTLDMGATPDSVATIMATAIIAYYTAAGAI